MERGWERHRELVALGPAQAEALLRTAFPGLHVLSAEPLSGGLRNTNLRLAADGWPSPVVLRLYTADPAACAREAAVLRVVPAEVPAPGVLHVEPTAELPWALFSWLQGSPLDVALGIAGHVDALGLAGDCGAALAAIHTVGFPRSGFLGPNLSLGRSLGTWSGTLDGLLRGTAGRRLGPRLTVSLGAFVAGRASEMDRLFDRATLCHGDFKAWNLLAGASPGVDDGRQPAGAVEAAFVSAGEPPAGTVDRPRLAGIVDWEFAFAGPPLFDVGTFLRDDARLPAGFGEAFAAGYRRRGGELPTGWRRLARGLDLINLCQLVERGDERTLRDLRPLIERTIEAG